MLEIFEPITHKEPARKPTFGECEIDESVQSILEGRGIAKLYKHQCDGIAKVRDGKNVVVVAPTASGKSEVYLVPVVEEALKGKKTLVLYPTKALSRDQLARFREFTLLGVRAEVYDGDTAQNARAKIRANFPHILISNVDMLHHMLMRARLFNEFWKNLRFVVVDEIHSYTGVSGAHAANVFRRLKRVLAKNGAAPQFICSSATVGNAKEFAEKLFEEQFAEVDANDAPKSAIEHYIIGGGERGEDLSYTTKTIRVLEELRRKTLIFGNSHSVVERLSLMARDAGIPLQVYRAGLHPNDRKKIEMDFKSGKINALATTSALELGMDIGSVDAVVLAGFPGTITRVKQRLGRAGRKGQTAIGVYVARDNPLDLYYAEKSDEYLYGAPEDCYVNPDNPFVLEKHLLAKMRDWPLEENELGDANGEKEMLKRMIDDGEVKKWGEYFIPTKDGLKKLRQLSIRGAGSTVKIFDVERNKAIGEREIQMAIKELYPGALYLHGGRKYESLKLEKNTAFVTPVHEQTTEYTVAQYDRNIEEMSVLEERDVFKGKDMKLKFGRVHVTEDVFGFITKDFFSEMTTGRHELAEPLHYEYDTNAIWTDFDPNVIDAENFGDGLHALEHVSISMMPALSGADQKELGGLSYPHGRMYVYEGVAGGSGLTQIVFHRFEQAVGMALERLKNCKCEKGCPKCVLDPMCGNNNKYLSKEVAILIAESVLK
ncbi:ATP-dependent DNA helicase Hel308 [Candidatus Gugararchaeum adminiculabundum]|nr:ATP-dependent DNA helicase Hel308 [Candidatus Gugararchaeum adminiculabundum]